tara:strand:- start:236 stop:442 length:207 start_codon:yes stop_codon:yes gene_type:complete
MLPVIITLPPKDEVELAPVLTIVPVVTPCPAAIAASPWIEVFDIIDAPDTAPAALTTKPGAEIEDAET